MSVKIAIVNDCYDPFPKKIYENDFGEIWNSQERISDMHNISMGSHSIPNPLPDDSLLVLEPYCVAAFEYNLKLTKQFKYIFTWTPQAFTNPANTVEINYPSRHDVFDVETMYVNSVPWNKRTNEVVFIYNNKTSSHPSQLYTLRSQMAEYFHQSSIKTSWYGRTPINKKYFKGSIDSKDQVLQKSKFVVCMENCYDPIYSRNYFTEKFPEIIESGAIPLYIGCHNIDDFNFHKDSYIDLRKYILKSNSGYKINIKSLLDTMLVFNEQKYQNYKTAMIDNIKKDEGIFYLTSYQRMYDTMINTYKCV